MSFRINTNVAALNGIVTTNLNSTNLNASLERLSSGMRINSAKDDPSGLAISDQLKTQASTLGEAINNGNIANSLMLTADKAMDEQIKILDSIKTKATAAAQDGQSLKTRNMLQADINRLMEELDNIANTTSFNGKQLLSGGFSNQEFQIGGSSNQTVKATIGSTQSSKIGVSRFETGSKITAANVVQLTIKNYNGISDFKFNEVKISYSVNTGLGALAEEINRSADKTGVRASYNVTTTGVWAIKAGNTNDSFAINGVSIGRVDYQDNDSNGALVSAINAIKDTTGVEASIDSFGRLSLTSTSGRAVYISGHIGAGSGIASAHYSNFGRLSLVKNNGTDILLSGGAGRGFGVSGAGMVGFGGASRVSQYSMSLRETKSLFNAYISDALGMNGDRFGKHFAGSTQGFSVIFGAAGVSALVGFAKYDGVNSTPGFYNSFGQLFDNQFVSTRNLGVATAGGIFQNNAYVAFANSVVVGSYVYNSVGAASTTIQLVNNTAGVTTLKGAMAVMDVAETAILNLDQIRADIGSVQQQIEKTINNISTTQVNLKAAESVIRDVDFAAESANYSKASILAQSGAYALAQSNASTQYVLRLLQ
ncbi:flagellin [Campylobacter troglodytis]|uniref:flagellin n=1 Tax=Campylobacter troglodytis TaxID=654363 RepID=UPI00115828BF|nr:flagellin [Campylobacter troglodytis]TQR60658.1 flagellin [Campylobacter troglodytis]